MLDDFVALNSDVKLVSYSENYRALHVITGIIIKLNTTAALVLTILEEKKSFQELILSLEGLLPDSNIEQDKIRELILELYCRGFVDIEKNISKPTILLINPSTTDSKSSYRKRNTSPPLGLLLIGTVLSENDYNVYIVDMDIENLIPSDIIYRIKEIRFNYVGISMNFSLCANSSLNVARQIKQMYNDVPIIIGGNHATFMSNDLIREQCVDYIIKYNGHDTFVDLVNILERKNFKEEDLLMCKGITFRSGKNFIDTEERDKMYDLNKIPLLDWNLLALNLYLDSQRWCLFTSIGCTNSCHFCSTSAFNGRCGIRRMSHQRIIEQIENIFKYAKEDSIELIFVDDAFTADKNRVIELCKEINNRRIKIKWGCNARADQVDKELLGFMKKAHCNAIFFGVESCDEDVLISTNKRLNIDLREKFLEVQSFGIDITLSFIIGLPKETKYGLLKMEDFIRDVRPHNAKFTFLVLYPGTEYYINKDKYGIRQLVTDWNEYERYRPYLETDNLSAEEQMEALIRLTECCYSY